MMTQIASKIIVVGGGISGSMAALKAAELGADVTLLSNIAPRRSPSASLRCGINAVLDGGAQNDTAEIHTRETIACGGGIADQNAVEDMCKTAPSIVNMLDRMGVLFNRTKEGLIEQYQSKGSTKPRTAAAGNSTGHQVICALDLQIRRKVLEGRVKLIEGWEFLSLIIDNNNACRGVVAANLYNMEIRAYTADAVIICTGGYDGLMGGLNPNLDGFGIANCFTQGAKLANLKFGSVGGLLVDNCHATNISGLFAAGGASSQYHGSAILEGNNILASIYGGIVAGNSAVQYSINNRSVLETVSNSILEASIARENNVKEYFTQHEGEENIRTLKNELCLAIKEKSPDKVEQLKTRFNNVELYDLTEWSNTEIIHMRRFIKCLELANAIILALSGEK